MTFFLVATGRLNSVYLVQVMHISIQYNLAVSSADQIRSDTMFQTETTPSTFAGNFCHIYTDLLVVFHNCKRTKCPQNRGTSGCLGRKQFSK